jgi:hypothetical protein
VEDTAPANKRGSASPIKKKPGYEASTLKQKDPDNSRDSSDEDDFYEGSGSEGSALGEGQYGKVLTCFHFAVCLNERREHLPLCPYILAPKLLNYFRSNMALEDLH